MKKLAFIFTVFFMICAVSAKDKNENQIRVGVLNGPSCIPAAWLIEKQSVNATYTKFADPQALLPKMIKKEIDIGFLPANVAAKVYNASNKAILCCAITGNGNLTVVTNAAGEGGINSLSGETVYVAGQGATPEYMFKYILEKNQLKPEVDVRLDFSLPTAQLPAYLISGKIKYAVLPEPFSTIAQSKSDKIKVLCDLQQEFEDYEGKGKTYSLTVMVVTKSFIEENPQLLNQFLKEYEKSYKWTIKNPLTAGQYAEKNELGLAQGIVTASIPKANYTYVDSKNMQPQIESLLKIFLDYAPESIGGKLPDKAFYYDKKSN